MNKINERLVWISVVILGAFMIQNQLTTNANLETLLQTYNLESNIQKAEIVDFNNQLHAVRDNSYVRGFEAGKTQAGIALANDQALYDYKEGYHAALSQFEQPMEANKSADSIFAELLIDFMDRELSLEESYWELLEYMTENPSLNANTDQPNK